MIFNVKYLWSCCILHSYQVLGGKWLVWFGLLRVVPYNMASQREIEKNVPWHDHWGHRTRVAAVTLDNIAEDAVAASASLRQIVTVSVRYCRPAFVSWLSMFWDTLTRNPELQWFGISPQFRRKISRGDESVGHVCFPGTRVSVGPDEGTAVYRWT